MDATKAIRFLGIAALWLITVLLGVGFVLGGLSKFSPPWPDMFSRWGYPVFFTYVVGTVEMVAGLLLLVPKTAWPAAATLCVVMLGATATHLVHGESNWSFTLILVVIFAAITTARYRLRSPRQVVATEN
jgi:uncharacterized membrane protein YphA (DoxX/SURF4 family)